MWMPQVNSCDLTLLQCAWTIVYFALCVCVYHVWGSLSGSPVRDLTVCGFMGLIPAGRCEPVSSFTATCLKLVPLLAESPLIYQALSAGRYVSHEHTVRKGEGWRWEWSKEMGHSTVPSSKGHPLLCFSFILEWKYCCFSPEFNVVVIYSMRELEVGCDQKGLAAKSRRSNTILVQMLLWT